MIRIKLVVAYLGAPFHGWQRQPARSTVQGELENGILRMTKGVSASVVGAGRTDAGVHAAGQVAHVDLPMDLHPRVLMTALNDHLPDAIRLRSATAVRPTFHARFDARAKHYAFRARWSRRAPPWHEMRSARLRPPADMTGLLEALHLLAGRHDWASFTVRDAEVVQTQRTVFRSWLSPHPDGLDLHFLGDGFLRYQVRRMVGALFEVGWRQRSLDDFRSLLSTPSAGTRVLTAPARGLSLERVYYRRPRTLQPGH